MFAKAVSICVLSVSCAIGQARAQETGKPLSDLPADVFAPARRAKIAESQACQDAGRERFARARDRVLDLLARWKARLASPLDAWCGLRAVAGEVSEGVKCVLEAVKLRREAGQLVGEVEDAGPPRVRPKPVWPQIEPLPADPMLAWITDQDGVHGAEHPMALKPSPRRIAAN